MLSMTEQQTAIRALEKQRAQAKAAFEAENDATARQLYEMRKRLHVSAAGLDQEKIDRARQVLEVRGTFARAGEDRQSVVRDAITYFLDGPSGSRDLRACYFGTKSYEHWHGQRSDHQYGFGPRHGRTIFAIGLQREYRDAELSPEDTEACIYFLTCIEAIQTAEAAAA